jgi:hypothetical protein
MQDRATFGAPWGSVLKLVTTVSTMILLGIALLSFFTGPSGDILWILMMAVMPLSIWGVSLLFMIRGYVLTKETLLVRRLLWDTRISLSGLQSAYIDAEAVKGSIRTFGNGGMFCFAGWFRNKRLGSFRVFATNSHNIVVLRFVDKTIVVTPSQPYEFVSFLKKRNDSIII